MEDKFFITPEEAVALFRYSGENIYAAIQIHNAYVKHDPRDGHIFAYAACFHAGIIEGVRRERAKRKKGAIS